jgi:hypothetical protein
MSRNRYRPLVWAIAFFILTALSMAQVNTATILDRKSVV